MKKCKICQENKQLEEFANGEGYKDGKRNECKKCSSKLSCERQKKNLSKVLIKNRLWREKNKEHYEQWLKNYRPKQCEQTKNRYKLDDEYRQRRLNNARKWRQNPNNKETIKNIHIKQRERYRQNPQWRAVNNLRRRMLHILEGNRKTDTSIKLIGCSKEELYKHLESLFKENMSWNNYGKGGWVIDHIKPCSSFDLTKETEQKECFHYTNLQPLWEYDNLKKGDRLL